MEGLFKTGSKPGRKAQIGVIASFLKLTSERIQVVIVASSL